MRKGEFHSVLSKDPKDSSVLSKGGDYDEPISRCQIALNCLLCQDEGTPWSGRKSSPGSLSIPKSFYDQPPSSERQTTIVLRSLVKEAAYESTFYCAVWFVQSTNTIL